MKATLKLVKELEEDLKMSDFSFRSWETLVAVILVDEYGVDLEGLEMREEDESKVKKLLKGKADDTVEVTFERKFDEYDEIDVPKFFGMVAAFRPYSEAEIYVPKEDSSNSYSVSSSSSSDNASVAESSSSYEVETASAPSSSSSNSDIDEFLDDYEEYVDKYISYAKKAANGDLSAMTEYVSLMEKAQSLSEKINNMSGEMSSAQMTRYTKITAKMASAAGM